MIDLNGTRVVAFFAHPDDESFGIAGTLAALSDRGAQVTLISATRGEEGEIADPSLATPDNLGTVREQELRNAAAALGISDVRFLDYRDSGMAGTPSNNHPDAFIQQPVADVSRKITDLLRELRPDAVITYSEEGAYLHPDHIFIHDAVVDAVNRTPELAPNLYFTSFPREFFQRMFDQGQAPFADMPADTRERMGQPMSAFTLIANVEPYADHKLAAIAAHKTQQPAAGTRDFIEDEEQRRKFTGREHFIRASPPSETRDPMALLAVDLGQA